MGSPPCAIFRYPDDLRNIVQQCASGSGAIGKDESQILFWVDQNITDGDDVFFRRLKKMWTTTRSKRQLDSCCLNSDLICIYLFWQVEDLAQQAECPDIGALPNVLEKEVNTKKMQKSQPKTCLFACRLEYKQI